VHPYAVGVSGAVSAVKPTWTPGASFSLKSRKLKENSAPANGAAANGGSNGRAVQVESS
jgi:hypothetical protein